MSKDGSRKLGTFPSRKQAEEREKQITRIKYAKGGQYGKENKVKS